MKALLLTENWPPQVGGIQNYLTQTAGHLSKGSIDVVAPKDGSSHEIPYGPGVHRVERLRWFWPVIKPAWYPLWRYLLKKTEETQYDVTLCGKGLVEGLLGYYLKEKRGIPYVVFTYAMEIGVWSENKRNKKKLIKVLTNADRVVYINDVTKKQLLELGVTEAQLIKIWPGVDDRFFEAPANAENVLEKYSIHNPYILCVARLVARKGIDTLIEGFSEIEQTRFGKHHLVIVGNGPERENLERLAGQVFIGKSVHFLDNVPDIDLPALYSKADVFALTPKPLGGDIEGFGMVYIEAAACGVPSLGTNTGGVSEAVLHDQTGLVVESDSPAHVADALSTLLSDPELRERLGAQAKERAYDQFRWKKRVLLVKGMIDAIVAAKVLKT